ncbi:hypothetical protein CBM2589_A90552 [Cupriavidus taiwanensis]|uniref:Uncharacterized protein n=1 Tax=Cupriavidus taiwanensis TaxID=164546 RepID=A0A375CG33_9BURK|nr:hypothetical protein CBM2589_A90552 [Cupriavidus taiwanensis]
MLWQAEASETPITDGDAEEPSGDATFSTVAARDGGCGQRQRG